MTVEWTVAEAALAWGVSRTTVAKYIAQERVPWKFVGRIRVVLTDKKPGGEKLTDAQRKAWPRSRRGK